MHSCPASEAVSSAFGPDVTVLATALRPAWLSARTCGRHRPRRPARAQTGPRRRGPAPAAPAGRGPRAPEHAPRPGLPGGVRAENVFAFGGGGGGGPKAAVKKVLFAAGVPRCCGGSGPPRVSGATPAGGGGRRPADGSGRAEL